jgi:hypothetical protein
MAAGCLTPHRSVPTHQCAPRRSTEIFHLLADEPHRLAFDGAEGAAQRVQDPDLELFSPFVRQIVYDARAMNSANCSA